MRISLRACWAILFGAGFCAGCGGGGGSSVPSGPQNVSLPPTTTAFTPANVPVSITVPLQAQPSSNSRASRYLSPGTASVSVVVSTVNGLPAQNPHSVVIPTIASGKNCHASPIGLVCTGTVVGGIGNDVFSVATFGTTTATGTALSLGAVPLAGVTATNSPALLLTTVTSSLLTPVAAKVVSMLSQSSIPLKKRATLTLSVSEEDASGAAFLGNYPQPLNIFVGGATDSITINIPSPGPSTSPSPVPAYALAPVTVVNSNEGPITVNYDGKGAVLPSIDINVALGSPTTIAKATSTLSFTGYPTPPPTAPNTRLYVLYGVGTASLNSKIAVFAVTATGKSTPVGVVPLGFIASSIAVDAAGRLYVASSNIDNQFVSGVSQFLPGLETTTNVEYFNGGNYTLQPAPSSNSIDLPAEGIEQSQPTISRQLVWTDPTGNFYTTGMNSTIFPNQSGNGSFLGIFGFSPIFLADNFPVLAFDTEPTFIDTPTSGAPALNAAAFDGAGNLYLAGAACVLDRTSSNCTTPVSTAVDVYPPLALNSSNVPTSIRHFTSLSGTANLAAPSPPSPSPGFQPVVGLAVDAPGNIYVSQYRSNTLGTMQQGTINVYGGGPSGPSEAAPNEIISSPALDFFISSSDFQPGFTDVLPIAVGNGQIFAANPVTGTINVFPAGANGVFATPPQQFIIDPAVCSACLYPISLAVGPGR